jgi:hypothetical protein
MGEVRQTIKEVARLGIDNPLYLGPLLLSVSRHNVKVILINLNTDIKKTDQSIDSAIK